MYSRFPGALGPHTTGVYLLSILKAQTLFFSESAVGYPVYLFMCILLSLT